MVKILTKSANLLIVIGSHCKVKIVNFWDHACFIAATANAKVKSFRRILIFFEREKLVRLSVKGVHEEAF